ncbi:MAG: aminopeptidase, partial [Hydrogenophaga sp.]|uniref:aminopeptidase n=1 Tax=Hydrogenophaga sp. TaxID=1904254 RepID=UPI002ABBD049
ESFATAVERLGGERWLAQASPAARADYAAFDERRRAFRALTLSVRKNLERIYAQALDEHALSAIENENALRASKHAVMADFRQRYAELKAGWGGHSGYDAWVARANNASFAVQAAYDAQVPAFMALFEREGRDWPRFYDAVREWAALPKAERTAVVQALLPSPSDE